VTAAVAETARRLRAIIDEHGPDAVSFYVSGRMSLEAQYLVNKLVTAVEVRGSPRQLPC
jgi:sulfite reductase (NADPH) flavoprotein alpha-component